MTVSDLSQEREKANMAARLEFFLRQGMTVQEASDAFDREQRGRYTTPNAPASSFMDDRRLRRYSLSRVIRALLDPRKYGDAAGFERECSDEASRLSGREFRGFGVPHDVLLAKRTLSSGGATAGAELVATDLLAQNFIDVLRTTSVAVAGGATVLDGLVGNVSIPRKTSGSTANWIATEGGAAPNSEPAFDDVSLTPKTVGVYGDYTRQLVLQSTPSVESLLAEDLIEGIGTAVDVAALIGDGTGGSPTGITNTSGVLTSTVASPGSPTWSEIVEFETDVDTANALGGSPAFVTTPAVVGNLKTTEKVATTGEFMMSDNNSLAGYPCFRTNNVGSNTIIFGDWTALMIGLWSGVDVTVDPYTSGTTGTVRVVAMQTADVALRHETAFSINA